MNFNDNIRPLHIFSNVIFGIVSDITQQYFKLNKVKEI